MISASIKKAKIWIKFNVNYNYVSVENFASNPSGCIFGTNEHYILTRNITNMETR